MAKFMLKSFCLVIVLYIGVLLGIQHASQGMNEMKGPALDVYDKALQLEKGAGAIEATILGETYDLEAQKRRLREIQTFNIFSEAAETFSRWMEDVFRFSLGLIGEGVKTLVAKCNILKQ